MIELREDQDDVRNKLRVALRQHQAVLVYAPTGFGKTVLASALAKAIFEKNKRFIFCVHRVDLITQTAKTFTNFGIPFSYIAAGYHFNPHHRIYIASIPTLRNRLGKIPADYVVVDEAHLSIAAGWAKIANHYKDQGARLIGLTGSPKRLDGKPLGDVWQTMVFGPSVRWLIDRGHLSKYRAFSPQGLDLSAVHHDKAKNDYNSSELDDLYAGKAVLSNTVSLWKKYAAGTRTIAFAPSVRTAHLLAEQFREQGVMAVGLDGETQHGDRRQAFIGFADRQIEVIVNCSLFCEGFDLAAQVDRDVTIETVLDTAPSKSLAKVLQKWGRSLRKKPKPAVILDCVGGFAAHGFPDDERNWSLDGSDTTEVSVKICPQCAYAHRPAPRCPECDFVYPVASREMGEGRKLLEVEADLEEIDVDALRALRDAGTDRQAEQTAANILRYGSSVDVSVKRRLGQLLDQATAKGFRSPEKWAAQVLTSEIARQRRG